MRKRLFEIIELSQNNDKISSLYDLLMMVTIITSLIPLCTKSEAQWTVVIDVVTVTFFIIDYFLRLITANYKYPESGFRAYLRYPFRPMAIVDLLSILPSFGIFGQGLKVLKSFRLLRSLKVLKTLKALKAFKALKILRYSRSISIIIDVIKEQKEALITVGGLALGYIFIAALIVFNVEQDTFVDFFDAIYWACVSLTTVGYGDIYPVSTAGRIVTMLSSIVGIAIVALPSGIITAGYMEAISKNKDEVDKKNE